jgi:hypothetical protein
MLVDLGIEALDNIVSDGVKEMMAQIGGGKNNNGNKSVWLKAVKAKDQRRFLASSSQ